MTIPLHFLAETAVAASAVPPESAGGVTQILTDFGVRGPFLLAQIVNFSVVAFLLWRFAFKPVMATIGERQQKIDAGLKYADEMKVKLAAAEQSTTAALKDAQHRAQQIVADAQKAAKELVEKQQKEAADKAAATLTRALEAIELEKRKMLAEARTEIARLVVATTQRVLAQDLSEAERSRFNDSAARELAKV
jgi:F-type H+-transporting ATPase subunit b